MKIVVLDGYSLNPGDLSWHGLAQYGELIVFDRTQAVDIVTRCQDAEIVITNKTPLTANEINQLPKLQYIGVLATGVNMVDLAAATAKQICVTNVPAYGPDAVAQMVFAHILHHYSQVALHHQAVQAGQWQQQDDFCFTLAPLNSLKGKKLGIVGLGDIGLQVAQIGQAFGMHVLVNSRHPTKASKLGYQWLTLTELLATADVVSLHCPLTGETEQMINANTLKLMPAKALLVNTARGGLIDESALAAALNLGQIYAALDVLSSEPPEADNPLLSCANVTITPHIAWATFEARGRLLQIAVDNLAAFIQGNAVNQVNKKES